MTVLSERKQAGDAAGPTDGGSPGGAQTAGRRPAPPGKSRISRSLSSGVGTEERFSPLTGDFDLYRALDLEDALAEATGGEPDGRSERAHRLTIDSTMLALLLATSRRQQARGAQLRVLVGSQTPMAALEVTEPRPPP